jgi:hypothetical protein
MSKIKSIVVNGCYKTTITDIKDSTNVKKVKWDSVSKDLNIQFMDNTIYTYSRVPEAIYNNIVDGLAGTLTSGPWGGIGTFPSVGAAVHEFLIKGRFQYRKGGTI